MRFVPALACAVSLLLLCGCDEAPGSSSSTGEKAQKQTTSVPAQPVEVKEYSYPEFVKNKAVKDMLSNVISTGFDPKEAETFLKVSPFKDYNCDRCLGGEYYTYYEDDLVGILNSDGQVILQPDKYSAAEMVAKDLILLTPAKGKNKVEFFLVNGGTGSIISREEAAQVSVCPISTDGITSEQYSLEVRGVTAADVYDKIEKADPAGIVTERKFSEIYKAVIGNRCYYLVLDEYKNITVCEAPYALISFKIGGEFGQCYVLDGDDHTELLKMIHSFGIETISVKPSKDETLDYIRIESGLNIGEKRTVTMSPDGFCLTETVTENGVPNRFFSLYPKDTFVDLVSWVAEVASKEYGTVSDK